MTDNRYELIKELFHRARSLQGDARDEYLAEACAGDEALREEVVSLLANDRELTVIDQGIVTTAALPTPVNPPAIGEPSGDTPEALRRATSEGMGKTRRLVAMGQVLRANRGKFGLGLILLVALLAFGLWTYGRVAVSLDKLLADQLRTVLEADVSALRQWLAAVETDAQMWAARPEVRDDILALAEEGESSAFSAAELSESEHLSRLITTLATALRRPDEVAGVGDQQPHQVLLTHRRFDGFALISKSGLILGGHAPGGGEPVGVGGLMVERGLVLLERVLQGETVVVPPLDPSGSRMVPTLTAPLMAVVTPVHDALGQPAAMLGFFIEPSEEYAAILEAGRIGETGETYTFDARGVMLSESVFVEQLQEIGLLADGTDTAVLQIQLRDPGVDLTKGHSSTVAMADRPRTRMAADAIDGGGVGLDVDGYSDYRGVEVVGAWAWLDEYDFGIATEIDKDEGYRAMAALITSFRILFWGAVLLAVCLVVFAANNLSLQADVDRAREYGDYRVLRVLGEGGIGTVFLAEHKLLVRPAAVKVLRKDRITPESEQRFQQEVQLTSQLTNPHTVELYDFGKTTTGEFYYAMEYLPGLTLHDLVDRYGPQPQERVVHIVRQIAESLAEAHDLGIIHRDIKPLNILLCERGGRFDVVKVLDFGLVKDLGAPEDLAVTQEAQVSGSPLYMAPERFQAPLTVDSRADIWAVGCVAYALLSGREPFMGRTIGEIWNNVVKAHPAPLGHPGTPPVHPALQQLVFRCLAKDRDQRPASMHEIITALETMDVDSWSWDDARQWWDERADALPRPPKIVRRSVV